VTVFLVDASVAVKWFKAEAHYSEAFNLLELGVPLHVPDFFRLEMDNFFCKQVRRGLLTMERAEGDRLTLSDAPLQYHPSADLRDHAYQLAHQTRRSVYDCLYLALALVLNSTMVTADRRFLGHLPAGPLREHVLWIGDLAGPAP